MAFNYRYNPTTGLIDVITPNGSTITLRDESGTSDVTVEGDGYITGDFGIAGKLTVDGLIDPTALVLNEQPSDPAGTGSGEGTIWVKNDSSTTLVFTDSDGYDRVITRMEVSSEAGTSYTPQLNDERNHKELTTSSSGTLTLPDDNGQHPIGYIAHYVSAGTGQWTIVAGSGATVNFPQDGGVDRNKSRAQGAIWSVLKTDNDTWRVFGDLTT